MSLPGVYVTKLTDGTPSYRSGVTIHNKHISLGSYVTEIEASTVYEEARHIISSDIAIDDYSPDKYKISFRKYVILINLRDNGIYFNTPIYLRKKYFLYYLDTHTILTFDIDDLFYFSGKTIMKRNNHLYVADYGMQVNVLSRYGIREHAVMGRDYYFANGDRYDFRYGNIIIVNRYHGVRKVDSGKRVRYKSFIHINGDFLVGTYDTEEEAAIAYNKAVDILHEKGLKKNFPENYPESLSAIAYASIYNSVKISAKIRNYKVE